MEGKHTKKEANTLSNKQIKIINELNSLASKERYEVLHMFCQGCGDYIGDKRCYCMDDE